MKFVFFDKSNTEADIILRLLIQENMPFYIKRKVTKDIFFGEDDDEDIIICEELFDIHINTDLEHFDYIKSVADKRIENRIYLEKCYLKSSRKGRNVQRLFKKNITNTNRKNRG